MKNDLDYTEQMTSVNKMLADMKHDLNKEHHWDEQAKAQDEHNRERAKTQNEHWNKQKNYWVGTVIMACFAIVASATAVVLSK